MPKRIQRQNTKGWRKPDGAVYVGRGSKWRNPYRVAGSAIKDADHGRTIRFGSHREALWEAVRWYAEAIPNGWDGVRDAEEIRRELAGHDLMCWCPLDQPCHADVLLELANREEGGDDGQ